METDFNAEKGINLLFNVDIDGKIKSLYPRENYELLLMD
jgi:selenophosphate synthetase-related protein